MFKVKDVYVFQAIGRGLKNSVRLENQKKKANSRTEEFEILRRVSLFH